MTSRRPSPLRLRLTLAGLLLVSATLLGTRCAPSYSVEVRRTEGGIPHIHARDFGSLGYGTAYAMAQDNLCLMADQFLTYAAERSRFLGPDDGNLSSDFFYQLLIDRGEAEEPVAAEQARLFRGAAAGYNRYLRAEFKLPGMLILQFAFDGNPDNPYLNHRHDTGDIVYTGTHDNDTTLGWFESLDEHIRANVYRYFDNPDESMPWMLIRRAMASPAHTAIIPWQDFLALDGAHRMNTPGSLEGNWHWRFGWDQVPRGLGTQIRETLGDHQRLSGTQKPATAGPADPQRAVNE